MTCTAFRWWSLAPRLSNINPTSKSADLVCRTYGHHFIHIEDQSCTIIFLIKFIINRVSCMCCCCIVRSILSVNHNKRRPYIVMVWHMRHYFKKTIVISSMLQLAFNLKRYQVSRRWQQFWNIYWIVIKMAPICLFLTAFNALLWLGT